MPVWWGRYESVVWLGERRGAGARVSFSSAARFKSLGALSHLVQSRICRFARNKTVARGSRKKMSMILRTSLDRKQHKCISFYHLFEIFLFCRRPFASRRFGSASRPFSHSSRLAQSSRFRPTHSSLSSHDLYTRIIRSPESYMLEGTKLYRIEILPAQLLQSYHYSILFTSAIYFLNRFFPSYIAAKKKSAMHARSVRPNNAEKKRRQDCKFFHAWYLFRYVSFFMCPWKAMTPTFSPLSLSLYRLKTRGSNRQVWHGFYFARNVSCSLQAHQHMLVTHTFVCCTIQYKFCENRKQINWLDLNTLSVAIPRRLSMWSR